MTGGMASWAWKPSNECLLYWEGVRARIAAGKPANPNERPPSTLEEQADKQIARLERDLEEWREIKARAQASSKTGD